MTTDDQFVCIVCGAPDTPGTMSGCRRCGAQDEIVPRRIRQAILDRPNCFVREVKDGVAYFSVDGYVVRTFKVNGGPG